MSLRLPWGALATIVVLLLAWQLLYALTGEIAMRSPLETIRYTVTLVSTDSFATDLFATGRAFLMALVLSIIIGLALGFALGFNRLAREVFEPSLIAFYSVPKLTLYPLVLLAFGLGTPSKVVFGAIHGIVPIALFTITAVRNIRPVLIKTGRALRLSTWDLVSVVLFPAALPGIFSGLRIGFSLTLIGTILGEMFASQSGLGYLLMSAIGLANIDLVMSVTFLLVIFAATASVILLAIDRRLHRRL